MRIGISSACLYPMPTEEAVKRVISLGVKQIEIFLCSPSEMSAKFIDEIKAECDNLGVSVAAIHPWSSAFEPLFFFSGYKRRIEDGIELYKHYFEAAAKLGASHIVFHGDRRDKKLSNSRYFEVFSKIADVAKEYRVFIAQENVSYCKSGNPKFIVEMKEQLPKTKFVLDIKQCKRASVNPCEMIDAMGSNIIALHLSDNDSEHECMLPGCGKFDFCSFFAKLKELGIDDIPALIELYRDNYNDEEQLINAVKYLNKLL